MHCDREGSLQPQICEMWSWRHLAAKKLAGSALPTSPLLPIEPNSIMIT